MRVVFLSIASVVSFGCGGSGSVFDIDAGGPDAFIASDAAFDAPLDASPTDVGTTRDGEPDAGCVDRCVGPILTTCESEFTDCSLNFHGFCNPETVACETLQGSVRAWVSTADEASLQPGEPYHLNVVLQGELSSTTRSEPIFVSHVLDGGDGWVLEHTLPDDLLEIAASERFEHTITVTPPLSATVGTEVTLRVVFSVARRRTMVYTVTQGLVVGEAAEVPIAIGPTETRVPLLELRRSGSVVTVPLLLLRLDGVDSEAFTLEEVARQPGGGASSRWLPNDSGPRVLEGQTVGREVTSIWEGFRSLVDIDSLPTTDNVEFEAHFSYRQTAIDGVAVTDGRRSDFVIPVRILP